MGNAVGRLFVKDHFDAGAKEVVCMVFYCDWESCIYNMKFFTIIMFHVQIYVLKFLHLSDIVCHTSNYRGCEYFNFSVIVN